MSKPVLDPCEEGNYKFVVCQGNNSGLVKRVLKRREHWSELNDKSTSLFNFKWAPNSKQCNYELLSINGQKNIVNHFENHENLTSKDGLFISMHKYCESIRQNVFQYMPVQFVIDFYSPSYLNQIDQFSIYFKCI